MEKYQELLNAISIIKNHCTQHEKCSDCMLFSREDIACRIVGQFAALPSEWDNPEVVTVNEIVF